MSNEEKHGLVQFEQTNRCFFCKMSTRSPRRRKPVRRSHELTEDYLAARPQILVYGQHLFGVFQISEHARICQPCFLRADRFYKKRQEEQLREPIASLFIVDLPVVESPESSCGHDCVSELPGIKLESQDDATSPVSKENVQEVAQVTEEKPLIALEGFMRMSCTSTCCCIKDCVDRKDLHRINVFIRTHILSRKNVYISNSTRICKGHLHSEVWQQITTRCRQLHKTFSRMQITDMLKMLQKSNNLYLNFENVESINDSVFVYYTGLSKANFLDIIEKTQLLNTINKRQTALAALLSKIHTGDSNESLSSIFRVPKKQFARMLNKVKSCLPTKHDPYLDVKEIAASLEEKN